MNSSHYWIETDYEAVINEEIWIWDIKVGDTITSSDGTLTSSVKYITDDEVFMTKRNETNKSNELIIFSKEIIKNLYVKWERKINDRMFTCTPQQLVELMWNVVVEGINDADLDIKSIKIWDCIQTKSSWKYNYYVSTIQWDLIFISEYNEMKDKNDTYSVSAMNKVLLKKKYMTSTDKIWLSKNDFLTYADNFGIFLYTNT